MKKPKIAWYFEKSETHKTILNVISKELTVTVNSADNVGKYSCEFFETGKTETIMKMVISVTSNIKPRQTLGGIVTSIGVFVSESVERVGNAVKNLLKPLIFLDVKYTLDVPFVNTSFVLSAGNRRH